ncbi:MAG: MucR family transcriptional regulator [Geminicoccaceae bacterium]|jgi:predicted transcriptional regulator
MEAEQKIDHDSLVAMTAEITSAYVANNTVAIVDLAQIISTVADNLKQLGQEPVEDAKLEPAVPIKKSVTSEFIICLEDGKKLKMLKRHLQTRYGMTPDEYRRRWGLKDDYPMVAPAYAATRSALAKKIGLGRPKPVKKTRAKRKA